MRGARVCVIALLWAGCSDAPRRNGGTAVSYAAPATPGPAMLLKARRDTATKGWPGMELDVLYPGRVSEAVARATLQHVIDSVVARDTTLLWLRVTGFTPQPPKDGATEVAFDPALLAVWAPPDTTAPGARRPGALHRTFFTVIRPFAPDSGKAP